MSNVLRRGGGAQTSGEVRMGNFVFHIARGELKRNGETIRLTERERDLLRYFAQRPGMPVARHELAKDADSGGERAVDVQINRLRRKIEHDPANRLSPDRARQGLHSLSRMMDARSKPSPSCANAAAARCSVSSPRSATACPRASMRARSSSSSRPWCCCNRS